MARKRMIDPSFWIDEQVGTCPIEARLLFMGLISQADDDGRLNGHPALIKSLIYPYDHAIEADAVEIWLDKLQEKNLIIRYTINNQKYIIVRNFKKHQTINKPVKSKLPEPPHDNYRSPTVVLQEDESTTTAQEKLKEGNRSEEEGKGREEPERALLNIDQQKDYLRKLCTDMKIQNFGTYQLDIVYSYIGIAEIEVIEAAIKKSENKPHTYLTNTLHGMINVDKILKADQLPGAKAGDNNGGSQEGVRQGGSTFADKPVTGGKSGILPSKYFKVDENGELQVSGL